MSRQAKLKENEDMALLFVLRDKVNTIYQRLYLFQGMFSLDMRQM